MRLAEVISSPKSNIRFSEWRRGKMQPAAFRLRADLKTIRHGNAYNWRVITFDVIGRSFRVLILYNPGKSIYRATLGIEDSGVVAILCVHEFHAQEPGWHCHVDQTCSRNISYWNHRELQKWPKKPTLAASYDVSSEDGATEIALKLYRISEKGPLL